MLDILRFSGYNTAVQAIECGLPRVTREGRFLRGRLACRKGRRRYYRGRCQLWSNYDRTVQDHAGRHNLRLRTRTQGYCEVSPYYCEPECSFVRMLSWRAERHHKLPPKRRGRALARLSRGSLSNPSISRAKNYVDKSFAQNITDAPNVATLASRNTFSRQASTRFCSVFVIGSPPQ